MPFTERKKGLIALLTVTLIWGWTFIWMKESINAVKTHLGEGHATTTVGLFIVLRFGIAALLLPLILRSARGLRAHPGVWRKGGLIGLSFFGGFFFQLFGLDEVDPAVSAFLTSLYVVFTAIIATALQRKLPRRTLVFGVLLATFGAGSISGPPKVDFSPGEILTILAAFVFGVQIIITDRFTRTCDPIAITQVSFVTVTLLGVLTLVWGYLQGPTFELEQLAALFVDSNFYQPVFLSAVLGNVVALTLMMRFQKTVSPVRAAIIYGLEPVWAAMFSIWLGFSQPTSWLFIGGSALLAGNLIAELRPSQSADREQGI